MSQDMEAWTLTYDAYDPENEKHIEALCAIGNGYMGSRAACEENHASPSHYPGTYIAGLYNRLTSRVSDRDIQNEDMVNVPDWTWISFKPEGGDWFDIDKAEVLDFKRELNLKTGVLNRILRVKQPDGKVSKVTSSRLASMKDQHLAAIRYTVTPENYTGTITLRSGLNGDIENRGVERYNSLNQHHLKPLFEKNDRQAIILGVKTTQSGIFIVERAYHTVRRNDQVLDVTPAIERSPRQIHAEWIVDCDQGTEVSLEKMVAIVTNQDPDVMDPETVAVKTLVNSNNWDKAFLEHLQAWEKLWQHMDITVVSHDDAQRINRLHTYHLLCTASPLNQNIDAGLPARGLTGEAYRGHVFWDEIFAFPFYNVHFPEISRALLEYRYQRLDAAREYAEQNGYHGAMFPWQSGSDGREETQVVHLNPVSGEWGPDYSCLQRHVSLAIAYNTWNYIHVTGDTDFLYNGGAEMILSIADFWAGRCIMDPETKRYSIDEVMGPNEFHEKQPERDKGGLKDNAYTNVMTAWLLDKAIEMVDGLPDSTRRSLLQELDINQPQLERWRDITRALNVHVRDGIIDQYDGFMELEELDWDHYREKYGNIGRMDRILKAEGKDPDAFQLSKQGDLLMLFFVLPFDVVQHLLKRLGISFTPDMLRKNYEYYLKRTTHGSTLSLGVHAHVASMLGDMDTSVDWYRQALHADLGDIQGGTTKEGIHVALMASTITLIMYAYAGVDLSQDFVRIHPALPADWEAIAFTFRFRGNDYRIRIEDATVSLLLDEQAGDEVTVAINGKQYSLAPRQTLSVGIA